MTLVVGNCVICDSNDIVFRQEVRSEESTTTLVEDAFAQINYPSLIIDGQNNDDEHPILSSFIYPEFNIHKENQLWDSVKRELCECFDLSFDDWDSIFKSSQDADDDVVNILYLCQQCQERTRRLTNLLVQLKQTQLEISAIKASLCIKILSQSPESNNNTTCQSTDGDSSANPEIFPTPSSFSNKLTTKVNPFRQFIHERYSPHIILKNCVRRVHRFEADDQHDESIFDTLPNSCPLSPADNADSASSSSASASTIDSDSDCGAVEDSDPDFSMNQDEEDGARRLRKRRKVVVNEKKSNEKRGFVSKSSGKTRRREREKTKTGERIRKRRLKSPSSRQHAFEISPGLFQFRKWHFQMVENSSELKCLTCEKVTASRLKMLEHINTLHNTERFKCSVCEKSWRSQRRLDIHKCTPKVVKKVVKTVELPDGKIMFNGKWEYEKVNDIIGYKCGICGALKKTKMIMNRHIQERHADPSRFICQHCGRGFGNRRVLTSHLETHSNDPTFLFVCEECGFSCGTQARLYFHKQSHTQWICSHCNKSFKYKNGLVRHQKAAGHPEAYTTSTTTKNPPTSEYGDQMDRSGRENDSATILRCHRCNKRYQTEATLSAHLGRCRGNPVFPCEECGRKLSNIFVYRTHLKRHAARRAQEQQQQQQVPPSSSSSPLKELLVSIEAEGEESNVLEKMEENFHENFLP